MTKKYQRSRGGANSREAQKGVAAIKLAQVAASAREGLLALATETGLLVMEAMFDSDVEQLCGPAGKHNPERRG